MQVTNSPARPEGLIGQMYTSCKRTKIAGNIIWPCNEWCEYGRTVSMDTVRLPSISHSSINNGRCSYCIWTTTSSRWTGQWELSTWGRSVVGGFKVSKQSRRQAILTLAILQQELKLPHVIVSAAEIKVPALLQRRHHGTHWKINSEHSRQTS